MENLINTNCLTDEVVETIYDEILERNWEKINTTSLSSSIKFCMKEYTKILQKIKITNVKNSINVSW